MREIFARFLACLCLLLLPLSANAQEFSLPGFGGDQFHQGTDRNQPGGFHKVQDPLTKAGGKKVFEFSVVPRPCFKDDCDQQSARSTVQQHNVTQPKEAWYGWDMYFPADFAYGPKQVSGFNIYNEWKDQDNCMLVGLTNFGGATEPMKGVPDLQLSWRMANPKLPGDCKLVLKEPVADFSDLLGKWNRFEVFIRWSKEKDGKVQIYLDGDMKVDYKGETCFANCNSKMWYLFGHYICCTANTEKIIASKVYYKNISRSKERSGLILKD
jgi:hypothetical protein